MKTAPTRDCWWTIRLLCPLKNPKKSFCDHEQNDGVFSSLPFQVLFPTLIHFWSQRDPLWSVRHTFSRCQAFIYSRRATICPSRRAHMLYGCVCTWMQAILPAVLENKQRSGKLKWNQTVKLLFSPFLGVWDRCSHLKWFCFGYDGGVCGEHPNSVIWCLLFACLRITSFPLQRTLRLHQHRTCVIWICSRSSDVSRQTSQRHGIDFVDEEVWYSGAVSKTSGPYVAGGEAVSSE